MKRTTMLKNSELDRSRRLAPRLRFLHRLCHSFCTRTPIPGRDVIAGALTRLILPPMKERLLCPTIFGFDLCISGENGRSFYYLGFYELGTLHVMQMSLRSGDVFVDVGSSIGQMSLFASELVGESGKVVSFEPYSGRFADLLNSITANERGNIIPLNMALGDRSGEMELYVTGISRPRLPLEDLLPGAYRGLTLVPFSSDARSETVEVDTLDNVLGANQIRSPRMVKIDVEGFEGSVIQGATDLLSSGNAPILCFEHGYGSYDREKDDIFAKIRNFNDYSFFKLAATKKYASVLKPFDPTVRFRGHDNIFAFLPTHLNELPKNAFL